MTTELLPARGCGDRVLAYRSGPTGIRRAAIPPVAQIWIGFLATPALIAAASTAQLWLAGSAAHPVGWLTGGAFCATQVGILWLGHRRRHWRWLACGLLSFWGMLAAAAISLVAVAAMVG
jgi:hypothetical protein